MAIVNPIFQATGTFSKGNLTVVNPKWRVHSYNVDVLNSKCIIYVEIGNNTTGNEWRIIQELVTMDNLPDVPTRQDLANAIMSTGIWATSKVI